MVNQDIMDSSARNNFVGYNCMIPDGESVQRCSRVDTRTMRDTASHGTSIVGLIAGAMGGVNPNALIIPLALGPSLAVVCILRALRTILVLQLGTATPFQFATGMFTP